MSKRRPGSYLGGSTVITIRERGLGSEDRSYIAPPFTAAEEAENERLKAEMLGSPGLITREQMRKTRARKRNAHRT
jgi:hypothetical protein